MVIKRFSDYMDIKPEVKRSNAVHSRLRNQNFYSDKPDSFFNSIYHRRVIYEQNKNNRILTKKEKIKIRESIKRTYHFN